MATLETANALTSTSASTGAISAGNHALQNGSGNNRVVALFVFSGSGQVGNIGISSITYNSVAPYASTTLNHSGSVARNVMYVALWRDADLPASSGSYAVAFTLSNQGASPWTYWYVIELTGVDQTTIPAEAMATNDNFGVTTQSYTRAAGDLSMAIIAGANSTNSTDPTFSWGTGDNELNETADSSNIGKAAAVAYTTDSTLAGTSDTDMNTDLWVAFSLSDVAAGGATPKNRTFHGPFGSPVFTGPF